MNSLINLSEATSIAIHSVAFIANSDKVVNAGEISTYTHFSKNHIAIVLQLLTKHNFLESERGPSGGFKIKRAPEEISLLDIYTLMEGKPEIQYCGMHESGCIFTECVYGNIMDRVSQELINFMQNRTIKDLMIPTLIKK